MKGLIKVFENVHQILSSQSRSSVIPRSMGGIIKSSVFAFTPEKPLQLAEGVAAI